MTNLKELLERNPLTMSLEAGQKRRKGYQYVPDIPTEEIPLPSKRERKKVQYNDYINPVKPSRKSPPRKRKKNKKTKPVKKQKLDHYTVVVNNSSNNNNNNGNIGGDVLQTLNDKKRELEENLRSINAMLETMKDIDEEKKDSVPEEKMQEEEPVIEQTVTHEPSINEETVNKPSDIEKDIENEVSIESVTEQSSLTSPLANGDEESEQNSSNAETTSELAQGEVDSNMETQSLVKTPVRKTKKTKRRKSGSDKKKKASKSVDPNKKPRRITRSVEMMSTMELAAQNNATFMKILNNLMKHKYSYPFLQPVDPVALQIPDYPLIIKNPMDFGTIKSKLENSAYLGVKDFADDVNLVFSNAFTYNQPGSDVYIMASTIKDVFIKKINPILTKHGYPVIPATPIPTPLASTRSLLYQPISPGYSELKKSVDSLKKELQFLKSREQKIVFKVEKEEPLPMTREEKRKLSLDINKLSGEHLKAIVKIIRQKMNIGDADEIVIDLDQLDTATLRNLEQYVASIRRKGNRNRNRSNNRNSLIPHSVESRIEQAIKTEELTAQKIEDVQKRIAELKKASNARNQLTSSTTIAFSNPIDFTVVSSDAVVNNTNNQDHESESDSGSEDSGSDSEDSSSESESDSGSGSDSEPEKM